MINFAICILIIPLIISGYNVEDIGKSVELNKSINISEENIIEREYKKINNNLYYTDELIEYKGREDDKSKILNCYLKISEYLSKRSPLLSFCINNFNYNTLEDDAIVFQVYQFVDGAIVDGSFFTIEIENGEIASTFGFYDEYTYYDLGNFISPDLKLKSPISTDELKRIVLDLAEENKDIMFSSYEYDRTIKGTYYLKYSNEKSVFYYMVELNYDCFVEVDAQTGSVIDSFFYDGSIY